MSFPKLGIKLSFLSSYANALKDIEKKTTDDICQELIKPFLLSGGYQCSYCEYLLKTDPTLVGEAHVFISHAWRFNFLDVVHALEEFFSTEPDVIIWFDLFSNNQFDTSSKSFDWWCNTFKTAIQEIGRTVMVLSPWNDPVPLTRGWCIWELYCTIATSSLFTVAMTKTSESQFVEDIDTNTEGVINRMLATINCQNSQCGNPNDKEQIHKAIRQVIGFNKLNETIFEKLREWIISHYQKEYERRCREIGSTHPNTLMALNNLALLYRNQGKYDRAESFLLDCLEKRTTTLGENEMDTLQSLNNLALLYAIQGKLDKAEPLYITSLEKSTLRFGETHPNTLTGLNNLADFY